MLPYILHLREDCGTIFSWQREQEIPDRSRSTFSSVVTPLPLVPRLLTTSLLTTYLTYSSIGKISYLIYICNRANGKMAIEHKKLFRVSSRAPRRVSISIPTRWLAKILRGALDDTSG